MTRTLVLVNVFLVAWMPSAWSCSCGTPDDPATALSKASAVFRGRVTDVHDSYSFLKKLADKIRSRNPGDFDPEEYYVRYGFHVEFEVNDTWKGAKAKSLTVVTGRGGGDCGYTFLPGATYLVYAYLDRKGVLHTNICSRTVDASRASADLRALGPPLSFP